MTLAGFEGDGGDRQRAVAAVVDGDLDLCGRLQIGAEYGWQRGTIQIDRGTAAGQVHVAEGAADLLAGGFGFSGRATGDARNVDAFDWKMGGNGEVSAGLVGDLVKGAGGDGRGVEGLGFAAGRNGGAHDHIRGECRASREGCERDVQRGCGGLLQMKGGVFGQTLGAEFEECELTEGRATCCHAGACEEVLASEVEGDIGVGARGHLQIEADGSAELVEVEDRGGFGLDLLAAALEESKGDLALVLAGDEAKIGERRSGAPVEGGIEDDAVRAGLRGGDRSLIAEMRHGAARIEKHKEQQHASHHHAKMPRGGRILPRKRAMAFTVTLRVKACGGGTKARAVVWARDAGHRENMRSAD